MAKILTQQMTTGSWWAGVEIDGQMYDYVHKNKKKAIAGVRKKAPRTETVQSKKARARRLMKFFLLTFEEYEQIKKYQENHPVLRLLLGQRNSMDHSHETGLVRGLLEWRINKGYGLIEKSAGKDTAIVLRALAYFYDNPPATKVLGGPRYGIIGLARNKKCKLVYGPPKEV